MQPLLKPSEVGRLLGVHPETVKAWGRSGHLRGVKVGNRWRFTVEAVQDFLASRTARADNGTVQCEVPRGKEKATWHCFEEGKSGGSTYRSPAQEELANLLAREIGSKRRSITTN